MADGKGEGACLRYLTVKNWKQFQHYTDRNPPWIKLHRALLDDYEFSCLQDASKLLLILIWLLASQNEGRIPDDAAFLQKKLSLTKLPDLKPLIDHGFLIAEQVASNTLADSKQNGSDLHLEKRREEKSTSGASKQTPIPKDFGVSKRVAAWAAERGVGNLDKHLEHFVGLARAKDYRYVDWDEALMNAIRNDWAKLTEKKQAFPL